jgi:hypothetical protein
MVSNGEQRAEAPNGEEINGGRVHIINAETGESGGSGGGGGGMGDDAESESLPQSSHGRSGSVATSRATEGSGLTPQQQKQQEAMSPAARQAFLKFTAKKKPENKEGRGHEAGQRTTTTRTAYSTTVHVASFHPAEGKTLKLFVWCERQVVSNACFCNGWQNTTSTKTWSFK